MIRRVCETSDSSDMRAGTFDDAGWTERWGLADRQLVYAFSLDVHYRLLVPDSTAIRLHLCAITAAQSSTYHVCDEAVTPGADGALHAVPHVKIISGDDWIDLGDAGMGVVNGALIAQSLRGTGDPLRIEYRGVAALPRGFERLRGEGKASSVPGTAFISTRHVSSDPKFHWLEEQPLFGFGQVLIDHEPTTLGEARPPKAECRLKLSFDLYSGV
jgi:hypothetical protein